MLNGNRKRRASGSSITFSLHLFLMLAAAAALALGYIWLDMRGEALGERINQLERERAEIQRRYHHELWKWEATISPSNIETALSRNGIEMVLPDEMHIVRLRGTDVAFASLEEPAVTASLMARLAHSGKQSVMPDTHD